MRKTASALALLALASTAGWGQQTIAQPDKDGVYELSPGVKAPKLVHAATAVYPADPDLARQKHVCMLTVVIGADGIPAKIGLLNKQASPFDDAAIAAVRQSQFEPGTVQGNPVPVHIFLWVPFVGEDQPAVPETKARNIQGMKSPTLKNRVNAEYSDQARRAGYQGVVLIQMLVTEEGLPADARVVRPLGMGLDENALKTVRKYRFSPATLDGVPTPYFITVEVNFRLYR